MKDALFTMNLDVPFNKKAYLVLSLSELETLKNNGTPCPDFQKKTQAKLTYNALVLLGSGLYKVEYIKY